MVSLSRKNPPVEETVNCRTIRLESFCHNCVQEFHLWAVCLTSMAVCTYCSQLALFSLGPVLSCGCVGKEVKSTEKKRVYRGEIGGVSLHTQLERKGESVHPHPHQAGLNLPSWCNARQTVAIASLFVLSRLWSDQKKMERDLEIKKKKREGGGVRGDDG